MESKKRNELLDVLRGLGILIVILGHSLQGANGGAVAGDLHHFILRFQMELLFAISGFSAVYASKRTFSEAMKRHLLRLGLPYVTWVVLFYIAEIAFGIKTWDASDALARIYTSGFWFLRNLLFIYTSFEIYACRKSISRFIAASVTIFVLSRIPEQGLLLYYSAWFALGMSVHLLWRRTSPGKTLSNPLPSFISKPLCWAERTHSHSMRYTGISFSRFSHAAFSTSASTPMAPSDSHLRRCVSLFSTPSARSSSFWR